jgi:aldose 1-epimerase
VSVTNSQQFSIRGFAHGFAATANIGAIGAALTGYSVNGVEIAGDPTQHGQSGSFVGSTLAPWANRIAAGRWSLNGKPMTLEINEPARNSALHGLVADKRWNVVEHQDSKLTLGYRLEASEGYPFELQLEVSYEIGPDGLRVESRALNHATARAPFVMAFHPYFKLLSDTVLVNNFSHYLVTDENLIPVGETAPIQELGFDHLGQLRVIGADLDHGFIADANAAGALETKLVSRALEVSIWQEQPYRYLIVFTGKAGTPEKPGYVAVEPQTAATNAFNSAAGLLWLEPGEELKLTWGVSTKFS